MAQTVGRRRNTEIDTAVLAAAAELLDEVGYMQLSISGVAARAGVHKPALYRRWRSKALLVVDVLLATLPPMEAPDTGDMHGDLLALLRSMREAYSLTQHRQTLLGLLADLAEDPAASDVFHARFTNLRGAALLRVLERARERGEYDGTVSATAVNAILEGPLLHSCLMTEREITDELLALVAQAVCGLLG